MLNKLKKLIAPKEFYKRVLLLALPVMLQQGITNTVGLLDTLMVSSLGDFALGGVSIVSNIFFVLTALIIGAAAGSGIYIVQFFGAKNYDKMHQVFRARIIFLLVVSIIGISIASIFGENILRLFLEDGQAIVEGMKYLRIMVFTIIPLATISLYASTYRENQHTMIPMIFGIIAVLINLVFNYLLINGHFGFPKLGVEGAALATLLSRVIEALLLIIYAHYKKYVFAHRVYRTFFISKDILKNVFLKTLPLMVNEFFWSMGMIMLNLSYAQYGLVVVNAFTISSTINNLFFIIFGGLANGIAIIIGQELGANRFENIKLTAARLIAFGVVVCWGFGIILAITSPFTPKLYSDISVESQLLATRFMLLVSIFLWVYAYNASCFFILRAGGSTVSALIFDSLFTWLLPVPIALYVAFVMKGNRPDVVLLYFSIQCIDFIKLTIGTIIVRRGKWIRNLTLRT